MYASEPTMVGAWAYGDVAPRLANRVYSYLCKAGKGHSVPCRLNLNLEMSTDLKSYP